MPVMKKTILYSLFIASSINFSLYSQDTHIQDCEDLILIFDEGDEDEVYPLQDADTVCLMPEIQNYVDTPSIQLENQESLDLLIDPTACDVQDCANQIDPIELPTIVTCENEQEPSICQQSEDEIANYHDDVIEPCMQEDECEFIPTITQDQLEAILDCCLDDKHLSIDNIEMIMPIIPHEDLLHNDDVPLMEENKSSMVEIIEDDDIIPVPHDLINSVKKANKKKKKLEKLERKEKANFFKKSKKNSKKSN